MEAGLIKKSLLAIIKMDIYFYCTRSAPALICRGAQISGALLLRRANVGCSFVTALHCRVSALLCPAPF